MKRLIILLVLMLSVTAWAQNTNRNRNVLGAPVYYDTLGNVIGKTSPGDTVAHLPKHHYFNRLSNEFNAFFFEMEGLFGNNDLALGFNFTYLPERWGVYGSLLGGINHSYFSVGPALRLSDNGSLLDWHLYGGVMLSNHLGGELGFRVALPKRDGRFCWESVSIGGGVIGRHPFFTCGLSLEICAAAALYSFFW